SRIMKLHYTSFVIDPVYYPDINIFTYIATIIFPLFLWVVGNWALTTLFDGKGRLGQVYMASCYCMLPYPLVQIPLIILSNVVTKDERQFYDVMSWISLLWVLLWIVLAMGQIHEYSVGKNFLFTIGSLFAMLVIIFILLLFFSMISQGIAYFISVGKELLYRLS
ncbi:MAG: YIP1 family protein, partial [Lachnospiraceae bacterium]|nr:YIP1 family protein [Lachnospiraceae bacterium]